MSVLILLCGSYVAHLIFKTEVLKDENVQKKNEICLIIVLVRQQNFLKC